MAHSAMNAKSTTTFRLLTLCISCLICSIFLSSNICAACTMTAHSKKNWPSVYKNDWHIEHYGGKLWSEQLPENDQLIVDGETYVQWYDCITDYVL